MVASVLRIFCFNYVVKMCPDDFGRGLVSLWADMGNELRLPTSPEGAYES